MDIHVYHSSSIGNLYRVDDLLLEAGVPIKEVKRVLDFKLHQITACLISHEHGDHGKGAKDILKAGVDIYTSKGTASALGVSGHRLHIVEHGKQIKVGAWEILPFNLVHNAAEPLGFILLKGQDKLLFVTDTKYVPHRFRGLTHIMIETDYDTDILRENVYRKGVDIGVGNRVIRNHMSFKTAKGFFEANDMSRVREIYLLHLSAKNSDAQKFKREIEKLTGKPVYLKATG